MRNKRKKSGLWLRASYTVEAAFVMPVLLGVAFCLIYVMFYYHDRAVLRGDLSFALCSVAEGGMTEKEAAEKLQSKELFFFSVTKVQVEKKADKIVGEVTGDAELLIPVMQQFLSKSQTIYCKSTYRFLQPEQVMEVKQLHHRHTPKPKEEK